MFENYKKKKYNTIVGSHFVTGWKKREKKFEQVNDNLMLLFVGSIISCPFSLRIASVPLVNQRSKRFVRSY